MKVAGIFRDSRDGGASIGGDFNMVTGGLQRLRQHIKDESVVVRAQNTKRMRLDHLSGASISSGGTQRQGKHQQHLRAHGFVSASEYPRDGVSIACSGPSSSMKISNGLTGAEVIARAV
jgi:hypothetical protein